MSGHKQDSFTTRLGFFFSVIGIAIGAGNIWRFSRIVAQNGGGTFLIPWAVFLFLWSIPLLISEIGLGKRFRRAPVALFAKAAGPKYAWMGAFVALVTTGILFYYSVVVGWGLRYFLYSITGMALSAPTQEGLWESFIHSYQPLVFHGLTLLLGCYVIYKGISHGIEKSNRFLIPLLLILILCILVRAITLPGAFEGLLYLFTPQIRDLADYKIWIEALTQNAWDTGAGWGLLLVYAGFARKEESITNNAILAGITNNLVSIVMAMIIFSTAFSIFHTEGIEGLISGQGSTNVGLTFIFLPKLFASLPGNEAIRSGFLALFFLAFALGALSSMISMLQLAVQTLREFGVKKTPALLSVGIVSFILGAPSALNMAFFENQDWVWSLGLILNGAFIAFAVIQFGPKKFRKQIVNSVPGDIHFGNGFDFLIAFLIPLQAIVLVCWYFYHTYIAMQHTQWWNPLLTYSLGTIFLQWGIGLAAFLFFNRLMVKQVEKHAKEGHDSLSD